MAHTRAGRHRGEPHIYKEWIAATERQWLSSGERDRYPLISALDHAFRACHDAVTAEHLCVVFTTALEARARSSGANRQGEDH